MTQFTIAIFDFHIVALYSKSYPIKFTLYQQKINTGTLCPLNYEKWMPASFPKKEKINYNYQRVRPSGFEVSFAFSATCH